MSNMPAHNKPALTWPPLVGSDHVPRYIVIRDYVLTLAAWCVFAWMLRNVILLTIDWFREPFGQLSTMQAPDWANIWLHLRNYVAVGSLLAVWIAFWSVYRSRDLRPRQQDLPAPPPLEPALLCQRYGVTPQDLAQWQSAQIVTLAVAQDGHVFVP